MQTLDVKNPANDVVESQVAFAFHEVDVNFKGKLTSSTEHVISSVLDELVAKRIEWEIDDFNRSNLKLYPILGECYEVFQSMKGFSEEDKVYKQAFIRVCDNKGYKFKDSTHLMVRVVKYVFGIEDSKRISAYAMALRVAAEEGIKTENLAEYLFKNGGPEEVRRNKGKKPNKKDDSAENKSDAMSNDQKGRAAIYGEVLATFDAPDLMKKFDSGFYHGSVLLLATVETEGSFAIRRLIQDSVVIKTAYTKLASSVSKNEMAKLLAEDDAKLKAAYLETK